MVIAVDNPDAILQPRLGDDTLGLARQSFSKSDSYSVDIVAARDLDGCPCDAASRVHQTHAIRQFHLAYQPVEICFELVPYFLLENRTADLAVETEETIVVTHDRRLPLVLREQIETGLRKLGWYCVRFRTNRFGRRCSGMRFQGRDRLERLPDRQGGQGGAGLQNRLGGQGGARL